MRSVVDGDSTALLFRCMYNKNLRELLGYMNSNKRIAKKLCLFEKKQLLFSERFDIIFLHNIFQIN